MATGCVCTAYRPAALSDIYQQTNFNKLIFNYLVILPSLRRSVQEILNSPQLNNIFFQLHNFFKQAFVLGVYSC